MNKIFTLIWPVILCLSIGLLASRLQIESLEAWYPSLSKPSLTPPNVVFPAVWGLLYICMGVSFGLVISEPDRPGRNQLIVLFTGQLALNFCWSLAFFYLQSPAGGLVVILLLEAALICYAVKAWSLNKTASVLFWPYILWVAFATYLNVFILMYN